MSVIGRLAVDRDYAGRRIGADMLADALRRIAVASQTIGIGAVMVQAKNEAARGLYLRCAEFVVFPGKVGRCSCRLRRWWGRLGEEGDE